MEGSSWEGQNFQTVKLWCLMEEEEEEDGKEEEEGEE
jgi:hypothetical protein